MAGKPNWSSAGPTLLREMFVEIVEDLIRTGRAEVLRGDLDGALEVTGSLRIALKRPIGFDLVSEATRHGVGAFGRDHADRLDPQREHVVEFSDVEHDDSFGPLLDLRRAEGLAAGGDILVPRVPRRSLRRTRGRQRPVPTIL